jgi:hypothetical protein
MDFVAQWLDLQKYDFLVFVRGLTNDLIDFLNFSAHQFIQIKVLVSARSNNFFAVRGKQGVGQRQIREEYCLELFILFAVNLRFILILLKSIY